MPVVVIHDRGNMHKGEQVEASADEVDWLVRTEFLPPYAPELDPVGGTV